MKTIDVKGDVVDSETGTMYDWFAMQNVNPKAMQNSLTEANGEDLQLNISSNGGDVFAASEIYTMLSQYPGTVTGTVQGLAASAATIVAMACDHLVMSPTAQLMIHRSSEVVEGNTHDLQHESTVTQKVDESIAAAYEAKTGKSKDEILQLMTDETWLTAEDAVSQGFADEVMQTDKAPLVVDSLSPLPSKNSVKKFKQMITGTDDHSHSAIFKQKMARLKGINYEN